MAAYVVDSSVVIQYLVEDTYSSHTKNFFEHQPSLEELYVPEFCMLECVNVLWKRVRFQGVLEQRALQLVNDLLGLPLSIVDAAEFLQSALRIGLASKLAVYDSVYIAMAVKLNYPLVTVDQVQIKAAVGTGVIVKAITDFLPPTEENT